MVFYCENHNSEESNYICCSSSSSQTFLCSKCLKENIVLTQVYKEDIHLITDILSMEEQLQTKDSSIYLSIKKSQKYLERLNEKKQELINEITKKIEAYQVLVKEIQSSLNNLQQELLQTLETKFNFNNEFLTNYLKQFLEYKGSSILEALQKDKPSLIFQSKDTMNMKAKISAWLTNFKTFMIDEKKLENLTAFLTLSLNLTIEKLIPSITQFPSLSLREEMSTVDYLNTYLAKQLKKEPETITDPEIKLSNTTIASLLKRSHEFLENSHEFYSLEYFYNYYPSLNQNISSIKLNLSGEKIDEKEIENIGKCLEPFIFLQDISMNLSNNLIGCFDGSKKLCQCLNNFKSLESLSLDITKNQIDDISFAYIVNLLSNLKSIQNIRLNLSQNNLKSESIQNLALLFNVRKAFHDIFLDFSNNNIDDSGVVMLCHSLKTHFKFTLVLCNNPIKENQLIIDILQINPKEVPVNRKKQVYISDSKAQEIDILTEKNCNIF